MHRKRFTVHGARLTVYVAVLALLPHAAQSQSFQIRGQILQGTDGAPAPAAGVWAVLHRVGRDTGGGPVDSARTGADGRYTLAHAPLDTGAIYLVSATFRDITYFSGGLLPEDAPDSAETLVVYDTSSTAPVIQVAQRHLVVRLPESGGGRRTLELLELRNTGTRTRIAPDSVQPVWSGRLPERATAFEMGESDVSADAVAAVGDSVLLFAPVPPGRKQVLYTYVLPPDAESLRLELGQPHGQLTILLEDTAAVSVAGGLASRGIQVFEDAQFAMYDGANVPAGTVVEFRFTRRGIPTALVQALLVGFGALALAGGLLLWFRRAGGGPADAEALARQIAALDAAFESRAAGASPAERASYDARRARLRRELEAALAAQAERP